MTTLNTKSILWRKERGQSDADYLLMLLVLAMIVVLVVGCLAILTSKSYRFQLDLAGEAVADALNEAEQFGLVFGEERFMPKRYTVYTVSEGEDRNVLEGVIVGLVQLDGLFTEMTVNVPVELYQEAGEDGNYSELYDPFNCDSKGKEFEDRKLGMKYVEITCRGNGRVALRSDMATYIKFTYYTDQSALLTYEERAPNDISIVVVEQLLEPALGEPIQNRNMERRFPGLNITAVPLE